MSRRYLAHGLCIESEVDLPELPFAPDDRTSDVRVRREALPPPHGPGLMWQGADAFIRLRGVAYFRVRGGCEIGVDPMAGATDMDVRLALQGAVMGALCHQRGLLPLHAGAIAHGGQAIAFSGPSGIGKSTLVTVMECRNHEVLCDDVCVLSFGHDGAATAWPGPPRIKLCEDAVARLGRGAEPPAFDGQKYAVRVRQVTQPRPLRRIYLLKDGPDGSLLAIDRLAGFVAIKALMANVFRNQYLEPMGLSQQVFGLVTALARGAEVFTLTRPRGFERFDEVAAGLEAHLAVPAASVVA